MSILKTVEIGGKPFSIETGHLARLSAGAATIRMGESMVLVTANSSDPRPGIDFFPLTIDYREKTYSAGRRARPCRPATWRRR